jgi:hypothetical protein
VTYVASSLGELLAGGRVLVDPNTFSEDGTSSLASLTVSGNGQRVRRDQLQPRPIRVQEVQPDKAPRLIAVQ